MSWCTRNKWFGSEGLAGTLILWYTCKAFFRGKHIAFKAFKDKEKDHARMYLASEIKRLEEDLKQNPLPQSVEHLQMVYDKLN